MKIRAKPPNPPSTYFENKRGGICASENLAKERYKKETPWGSVHEQVVHVWWGGGGVVFVVGVVVGGVLGGGGLVVGFLGVLGGVGFLFWGGGVGVCVGVGGCRLGFFLGGLCFFVNVLVFGWGLGRGGGGVGGGGVGGSCPPRAFSGALPSWARRPSRGGGGGSRNHDK